MLCKDIGISYHSPQLYPKPSKYGVNKTRTQKYPKP